MISQKKQKLKRLKYLAVSAALTMAGAAKVFAQKPDSDGYVTVKHKPLELTLSDEALDRFLRVHTQEPYHDSDSQPAYKTDTTFLQGTETDKAYLNAIMTRLSKVPEGKALIDSLRAWDVSTSFDPKLLSASGGYLYEDKHMLLSPYFTMPKMIATLAHEGAHARQDKNGLLDHDNMSLEERLLAVRFLEADATAHAVLAAWQLHEQGDTAVFDLFAESPLYGPSCKQVETRAAEKDSLLSDGDVLKAAFDGWFEKQALRETYDHTAMIQNARRIYNEPSAKIYDDYKDTRDLEPFLEKLCVTRKGQPYIEAPDKILKEPFYTGGLDKQLTAPCVDYLSRRLKKIMRKEKWRPGRLLQGKKGVLEKAEKKERLTHVKERYRSQKKPAKRAVLKPIVRPNDRNR